MGETTEEKVEKYFASISGKKIWDIGNIYEKWRKVYFNLKNSGFTLPINNDEMDKRGIPTKLDFGDISISANDYFLLIENKMLDFDHLGGEIDSIFPFISAEKGMEEIIFSTSKEYPTIDYHYIFYNENIEYNTVDMNNFVSNLDKERLSFIIFNEGNDHAIFSVCVGGKKFDFDAFNGIETYRMQNDCTSCRSIALYFQEYFSKLYYDLRCSKEEFLKKVKHINKQFKLLSEIEVSRDTDEINDKIDMLDLPEPFKLLQSIRRQNIIFEKLREKLKKLENKRSKLELYEKEIHEKQNNINKNISEQQNDTNSEENGTLKEIKDKLDKIKEKETKLRINIEKIKNIKKNYMKRNMKIDNLKSRRDDLSIPALVLRTEQTLNLIECLKEKNNTKSDYLEIIKNGHSFISFNPKFKEIVCTEYSDEIKRKIEELDNDRDISDCFQYACKEGNLKVFEDLFERIKKYKNGDELLYSGFILACKYKSIEIFNVIYKEYISNKKEYKKVMSEGIRIACENKNIEAFDKIYKNPKNEEEYKLLMNETFKSSCKYGNIEIFNKIYGDIKNKEEYKQTIIDGFKSVCENGNIEIFNKIYEDIKNKEEYKQKIIDGFKLAYKNGNIEIFNKIYKDIKDKEEYKQTIIDGFKSVCENENIEIFKILFNYMKDKEEYKEAIINGFKMVCIKGKTNMLKIFLEKIEDREDYLTIIEAGCEVAEKNGKEKILEILLSILKEKQEEKQENVEQLQKNILNSAMEVENFIESQEENQQTKLKKDDFLNIIIDMENGMEGIDKKDWQKPILGDFTSIS